MREFSAPASDAPPFAGTLTDDVVGNARERPETVVAERRSSDGRWIPVDAVAFRDLVSGVARGLMAAGVGAGERVGLVARTRFEWTIVDYALWSVGAVSVPLYDTTPAAEVRALLDDAGAVAVVVGTAAQAAALAEAGDERTVWVLDDGAVDDLLAAGAPVPDDEAEARRTAVGPDDLATLIYTSGTTGAPRACRLTHARLAAAADGALAELHELFAPDDDSGGPRTLLFLPLAHVFARVVQVGAIRAGVCLGHASDVRRLEERLREFRPTFVLGVPRVFEQAFTRASQRATADGRGALFDRAAETAIAWSQAREAGRVPLRLRARHTAYDRMVYAGIRDSFGGECRWAVSGGAPLGERLGHFFRGAGLPVLEGYGLTETSAAITLNSPGAHKVGTVGRPLPGCAVRVADDGELLVRGPQVFDGYWTGGGEGSPAPVGPLDAAGWLPTGDVGEVDDEGFVKVTGRKPEILVTAGGKMVAPAALEERLREHPLVSAALVVGDNRPYVAALLTLDPGAHRSWAEAHAGRRRRRERDGLALDSPELLAELQHAVDEANTSVSRAESIRRFRVLPGEWSEEGGQLTPSLKLRRSVVQRLHRDDVEDLYR